MAIFQGFETIEVSSDETNICISQFNRKTGKVETIKVPKLIWKEFGKDVSNEIERATQG